ncbi:Pentatricopeptide repeat-containing protein [Platanthera guangdongensis]|uniref:Pentatricopeptide repeat-containing protein n=1 Tax=Platanthera guangdongensis TaxID=2320717 RepID=A0ABR2MPJ8_9ASPA
MAVNFVCTTWTAKCTGYNFYNMRRFVLLLLPFYSRKNHRVAVHVRFLSSPAEPVFRRKPIHKTLGGRKRLGAGINSEAVPGEIYRCNLRLSALGRRGDIDGARALFDQMPRRDVVTYASMIDLHIKNGDLPRAEALFGMIPARNVVTDSAMIDGLAKAGRVDEARELFDRMPARNVFTWTILLSGYLRSGDVPAARRVFDEMPEKNVVSWTTMVLGYARNGLLSDARVLFDLMPERNVVAWTAMINAYVDGGAIEDAAELFDRMPQRNFNSWNIMIKGYLQCNRIRDAVDLFESMPRKNTVSWTTMVSGLAQNKMIDGARKMFDLMPVRDTAAWNAMITAYASNGEMGMAADLFDSMQQKNVVTWNVMIDGYAKNGSHSEAMSTLLRMLRSSEKPNATSLTSLLGACDSMITGTEVHAFAMKLAFLSNICLGNAVVVTYSRNGDLGSAWLAFDELRYKDVVSWTSMILAFANHGRGLFALNLFAKMLGFGAQPDAVTFVGLLSACSHAGLVAKGRKIFDSMRRAYGVEPKAEHYSSLVDILGRAGRVSEASVVLNQVPQSEKDAVVLGAMLGACRVHGEVEIASQIADDLIDQDPSNAGNFVILANIYASNGNWNDVARVRKTMKANRVEKVPGFSQIDVKTSSHVLFAGDRSHSQCDAIYAMLDELLIPQMKGMECE